MARCSAAEYMIQPNCDRLKFYPLCRIIKISSPSLNYFIILGALLMYTSIYFYLLPSLNTDIILTGCIVGNPTVYFHSYLKCILLQLQIWFFTIGYSLSFGAVLAKMWRVYQIFNNPKPKKKVTM